MDINQKISLGKALFQSGQSQAAANSVPSRMTEGTAMADSAGGVVPVRFEDGDVIDCKCISAVKEGETVSVLVQGGVPTVLGKAGWGDELEGKLGDIRGTYLHVRFSAHSDGTDFTEAPEDNTLYMGVCSNESAEAPTYKEAYTWVLVKGNDGVPGETGADGTSSYLHIKYSNDGGSTFTANSGETVGDWMGTCVTETKADPTSVSSYTWKKVKGEQGEDGKSAYDLAVDGGFDGTEAEWLASLVGQDGEDGEPGKAGTDGKTSYLHIAYGTSLSGANFSTTYFEGATHMGTCSDYNSADPATASSYMWALIKGADGQDGQDGYTPVKGKDYFDGEDGADGYTPVKGKDYFDGEDGKDGADGKMLYGSCSTAGDEPAKTVDIDGFSLYAGVVVAVKFANTNTAASPTLNVSSTGAKAIMLNGSNSAYWIAGGTVNFVYDGTYWQVCSVPIYGSTATIGNPSSQNVYINGSSVDVRSGTTILASFAATLIELGRNAKEAIIKLCGGWGQIEVEAGDEDDSGTPLKLTGSGGTKLHWEGNANLKNHETRDDLGPSAYVHAGYGTTNSRRYGKAGLYVNESENVGNLAYVQVTGPQYYSSGSVANPSKAMIHADDIAMSGDNRPTWNSVGLATMDDISAAVGGNYLPITGGTMTGPIAFKNLSALPEKDLSYIVGIDSFSSGGEMGYMNKSDFLAGYLPTSGGTVSGKLAVTGGAHISGRYYGSGDDEGLVIGRASNSYAGLCLGEPSGVRSVHYLMPDNSAVWRYNNGSSSFDIKHPAKAGTIALTSDIPSLSSYATQTWVEAQGFAKTADIAATKYNSTSSGSATYFKIADFGSWGTGAWYQKGFSMLIGSRAGETVWLAVSADDSNTNAKAIRLLNTYGKIAAVYYNASESAVYVKANAWCNNITAHLLSNIGGDYVPSVTVVSAVPSGSVEVNIVEFGATSSGLAVGDSSVTLALAGSATRPTYNGSDLALYSDVAAAAGGDYLPLTGGTVSGDITANYITCMWLKTTKASNLVGSPSQIAVLSDGYIYYRTPAQLLGDIGAAASSHSHDGTYAKLKTYNDFVHDNNEVTMVPDAYSQGSLYFNYRTASGNTNGNINNYLFCNGKGGTAGVTLTADSFSGTAARATADANGNNIASTYATKSQIPSLSGYATQSWVQGLGYVTSSHTHSYLPLSGGTMTGQLFTSFRSSVAMGSYQAAATTIPNLLEEVRYSSGCMGSVSIGSAYSNGVTIPAGWYNFMYSPHRSGGANGAASGDNHNYGTLLLFGMTASNGMFRIRYSGGISEVVRVVESSNVSSYLVNSSTASLYDNATGTTGTVTLSSSAANYTFLEIFFRTNDSEYGSVRVYSPNGKVVTLSQSKPRSTATLYIKAKNVLISGTSISLSTSAAIAGQYGFEAGGSHEFTENNLIYITKVCGYK